MALPAHQCDRSPCGILFEESVLIGPLTASNNFYVSKMNLKAKLCFGRSAQYAHMKKQLVDCFLGSQKPTSKIILPKVFVLFEKLSCQN